jgi:hypothetical protein
MKISQTDFKVNSTDNTSLYYTTLQYQEYEDDQEFSRTTKDSDKVFAKAIKNGLSRDISSQESFQYRYYVRLESNKKLYDPFPKYSFSDNKNSFVDKVCKPNNSFKEVNKSLFDKYINFLKTENNQWYTQANRELSNAV